MPLLDLDGLSAKRAGLRREANCEYRLSDKSEQKCRIWKRAMHMGTVYRARLFRQRSAYGPTLLVARRWGR